MSAKIVCKLVISRDDKEVVSKSLSYDEIASIVSNSPDNESNEELLEALCDYPATSVRENIASKDYISSKAVERLSADISINVLRNLVRSKKFRDTASLENLESFANKDPELAQSIAGDIESYSEVDANQLASKLASLADLTILSVLAGSYNTPKKILKNLAAHPDPYIASQAKEQLENG